MDVNRIHFILASLSIEQLLPKVFERLDHYRGREYQVEDSRELFQRFAKASRFDDAGTVFVKRLLQVELPERLRNRIAEDLFEDIVGVKEESFVGELYLSMDQIRMMRRCGMEWGIHGYEHCWMNRLTPEELTCDITKAKQVFDGIIPSHHWTCCYPYGSVSPDVIEVVRTLGACCGLTTEVRYADVKRDDIYQLPRLDTNDFPPKSEQYIMLK